MSRKAEQRSLSRYDKLRALVRNPEFLLDSEFVKRGLTPNNLKYENGESIKKEDLKRVDYSPLPKVFSHKAVTWLFKKYELKILVTPELVNKYPPEVWEQVAVFADDDRGVRFVFSEYPKMIEIEEGTYRLDYSVCFEEKSTITIEIDLRKNKTEIMDKVSSYIDFFQKYVASSKSRRRTDEKIDRFFIWDEYKKCKNLSEIARKLRVDRTTVRKAYLRAFKDIMGEQYDPEKHDRRNLQKEELGQTCNNCPNRRTCVTPCPDILTYIKQDERARKEALFLDILPSEKNSDYFI